MGWSMHHDSVLPVGTMKLYSVVVIFLLFKLANILSAKQVQYEPNYLPTELPKPFDHRYGEELTLYRAHAKLPRTLRNLNIFSFNEVEEIKYSLLDCIRENIGKCPHIVVEANKKCPEYFLDYFSGAKEWNNFEELKHLVDIGTVSLGSE